MEVWSLVGKITMQGFATAQTQLSSLEKKIKNNQKAFDGLRKAGLGIVAVVGAIAGGAVTAAVKFEDAFAGVRKTVDATEEQFAALKQGILDMSERLPLTATEIAAVAEAAGQLGIATEDILDFTEVMVQLGISTNLSADQAATALARFANITGMAADKYDELGSTIVALGNNFATTESEIVDMSMRIAGAGTAAGMSETDILGLATSLSSLGLKAEAGGTAISNILLTMNTAVIKGGDELKQFAEIADMSADQFATAYRDNASDALVKVIEGLGRLNDSGADTSTMLEDLGLGGIRTEDVLLRTSNATGIVTDAIDTANKAWEENIALQEEVDKRNATAASMLAELKNTATNLLVAIGDGLLPALKELADKIMPIIKGASDWAKENQGLVKWLLAIAGSGGALMLFVGLIPKVIGFVSSFISGIKLLGNVTKILTGIQWLWNAAITANPIGLIIVGIAALIAAGVLLWKNWDKVTAFFKKAWANLKIFFLKGIDGILGGLQKLTSWIPGFGDKIDEARDKIAGMLQAEQFKKDAEKTEAALKELGDTTEDASETMADAADSAADSIDELTESIVEQKTELELASEKLASLEDDYKNANDTSAGFGDTIDGLTSVIDYHKDLLEDAQTELTRLEDAYDQATDEVNKLEDALKGVNDELKDLSSMELEGMSEFDSQIQSIQEKLNDLDVEKLQIEMAGGDTSDIDKRIEALKLEQDLLKAQRTATYDQDIYGINQAVDEALGDNVEVSAADIYARINELVADGLDLQAALEQAQTERATAASDVDAQEIIVDKLIADIDIMEGQLGTINDNVADILRDLQTFIDKQQEIADALNDDSTTDDGTTTLDKYAKGGMINEPTLLSSLATGKPYAIAGEAGSEEILPHSGTSGNTINQTFNVSATIRSESDVEKVAKQLYKLQLNGLRSGGVNG